MGLNNLIIYDLIKTDESCARNRRQKDKVIT